MVADRLPDGLGRHGWSCPPAPPRSAYDAIASPFFAKPFGTPSLQKERKIGDGSLPSAARAVLRPPRLRIRFTTALGMAPTNDSTPCRLPYASAPPTLAPWTPTKHPATASRGSSRVLRSFAGTGRPSPASNQPACTVRRPWRRWPEGRVAMPRSWGWTTPSGWRRSSGWPGPSGPIPPPSASPTHGGPRWKIGWRSPEPRLTRFITRYGPWRWPRC